MREQIRARLVAMLDRDLSKRQELVARGELFDGYHPEMEAVHLGNALDLSDLLDVEGWPRQSEVGPDAAQAAWIVAVHAIGLPDFQRRCLRLLSDAATVGEASAEHQAKLYDRICYNEWRPQRYGTQFDWDEQGKLAPWPIVEAETVDARRVAVGLGPLEATQRQLESEARAEAEQSPRSYCERQAERRDWAHRTGWLCGDAFLINPELSWQTGSPAALPPHEVKRRIGQAHRTLLCLSGGLANHNVLVDGSRVLRIYHRDPTALTKEAALLARCWKCFRTPRVLECGADFLVLEYVPHGELSIEHGAAVGQALAEIHQLGFDAAGELEADLALVRRWPDFASTLLEHVQDLFAGPAAAHADLRRTVEGCLRKNHDQLRCHQHENVLLHGDFKLSNLHWTNSDELLVLDWEFAYSGPALMDVGQLIRWRLPQSFVTAFENAYRASGGSLPGDWMRLAETFDLANLVGLLAGTSSGCQRARDVRRRIVQITTRK